MISPFVRCLDNFSVRNIWQPIDRVLTGTVVYYAEAVKDVAAFGGDLFEHGGYHTAGSEPRGPEIHQKSLIGVEHFFKIGSGNMDSRHFNFYFAMAFFSLGLLALQISWVMVPMGQ